MNVQLRAIPADFTHGGFEFHLHKRTGSVALFEKRKPTQSQFSFELILVQQHPAETICGRAYPAREAMPPSESWGTCGWTYAELRDAESAFRALVESRQEAPLQPADTPWGAFSSARGSNPLRRLA